MDATVKQALVTATIGVLLGCLIVFVSRRRLMTLRYTLGWLALCAATIASAALAPLIQPVADTFSISPAAVFLAAATVVLLALCIQLSITVSGLLARSRRLAEDYALLEARLREHVAGSE